MCLFHLSPTSLRAWARSSGTWLSAEPRPLDDRPPQEAAWAARDGTVLDQFADLGDWEPMHRPLIQVLAVVVSISLVVAGVGTVLEVLLAALTRSQLRCVSGRRRRHRHRPPGGRRRRQRQPGSSAEDDEAAGHGGCDHPRVGRCRGAGGRRRRRPRGGRGRPVVAVTAVVVVMSRWSRRWSTRSLERDDAGRRTRGADLHRRKESGSGWLAYRSCALRVHCPGRGIEAVQDAVRVHGPDESSRHDRRPAPTDELHRRSQGSGRSRDLHGDRRRSGTVDRRSSPRPRRRRRCRHHKR